MEDIVRDVMHRYSDAFAAALADPEELRRFDAFYEPVLVLSSPQGVMACNGEADLRQGARAGIDRYRRLGVLSMAVEAVKVDALDEVHALARVGWTSRWRGPDGQEVRIDFSNAYLLRVSEGNARIFAAMGGDEESLLRAHGIGV